MNFQKLQSFIQAFFDVIVSIFEGFLHRIVMNTKLIAVVIVCMSLHRLKTRDFWDGILYFCLDILIQAERHNYEFRAAYMFSDFKIYNNVKAIVLTKIPNK